MESTYSEPPPAACPPTAWAVQSMRIPLCLDVPALLRCVRHRQRAEQQPHPAVHPLRAEETPRPSSPLPPPPPPPSPLTRRRLSRRSSGPEQRSCRSFPACCAWHGECQRERSNEQGEGGLVGHLVIRRAQRGVTRRVTPHLRDLEAGTAARSSGTAAWHAALHEQGQMRVTRSSFYSCTADAVVG